MTVTDCGAACLAMVLGYHGREMTLDSVRELMGPARDGIKARAVVETGRKLGLRGRGVSLDLDRLAYLPPATILHWNFSHYVVFERAGRGFVQIVDPAFGRRRVSMQQFSQCFTGVALLFEPAEDFQPGNSKPGAYRYLLHFVQHSGTLTRILVLSAALQFLTLGVPMATGMVVDRVVPRGDYHLLLVLIVSLTFIVVFKFLASLLRGHLLLELRTRLDSRMTLGFLEHLVNLAYPFFQLRPAGDLMMRMSLQTTVRELLSSTAVSSALDGALVLFYLALLFLFDAKVALIVLFLGVLQALVFLVPRHWQRNLTSQSLELSARNNSYQISMLTGMQTLKAFGVEQRVLQNYSNLYADVLNVELARGKLNVWMDSLTTTLRLASPLIILSMGAHQVLQGSMTLGEMLSMNALAIALLMPLSNLMGTGGQLQNLGSYLERINDVLDTPPERPAHQRGRSIELKGAISLENVSFRYNPSSPPVVQNISVRIQPGQMVAIVGRSGAGKSTLANLLLGLYLPTTGRVLYDNVDLNELDLRVVRSQMGAVLQDASFMGASLRDNITLGEPGFSMEQVQEAARLSQLHDEIAAMPMQYETLLLDRGLSLSGGQRQRLALARALVRKPAILLLDEATSALDSITEREVQEALAHLRCTRIVIAHRLSTIRTADLILVMDDGRVVEAGTHAELLARDGPYTQLISGQVEPQERAAG